MSEARLYSRSFIMVIASVVIMTQWPQVSLAQQSAVSTKAQAKRKQTKKSSPKSTLRPKSVADEKTAADRIVLKDSKELLGQIQDTSSNTSTTILARRDWVKATVPDWAMKWENAERKTSAAAMDQRRERLTAWRQERPAAALPDDQITAWLDRELARPPASATSSPLIAIQLGRNDISSIERRSHLAAQALRHAWLLKITDPEKLSLAKLKESIADRGAVLDGDQPVAIDRLLPPASESIDHWLLRRAATEILHDEGLRYIAFGNTIYPEPVPGQPLDQAIRANVVEGAIRDVLGVGTSNPLSSRFEAATVRRRVGVMVTTIAVTLDLHQVSAESSIYYRNGTDWDRGVWRSDNLQVGAVPSIVVSMVANDPQVKAVMNLIDTIGAGFVSSELKERGLVVGTTVGGAVVLARTSLVRALAGLAFDVETKGPSHGRPITPPAQ